MTGWHDRTCDWRPCSCGLEKESEMDFFSTRNGSDFLQDVRDIKLAMEDIAEALKAKKQEPERDRQGLTAADWQRDVNSGIERARTAFDEWFKRNYDVDETPTSTEAGLWHAWLAGMTSPR